MPRSFRPIAGPSVFRLAVGAIATGGLLLGSAVAPVAAADGDPTTLAAAVGNVLTLPENDGFQDTAVLTVTSDAAGTVQPEILAGTSPVGPLLDPVELTDGDGDGAFTGSTELTGLSLAAGAYIVRVTSAAGGLSADAALTVGSGQAKQVDLAVSDTFFPFKDGYRDTLNVRVTAFDETETAVPFDGYVRAQSGSVTRSERVQTVTGGSPDVSLSAAGMPLGAATVFAKVHGNAGPNATSETVPLTFLATKMTSAAISKSVSTVYPTKDGFKDSVSFAFSGTTSTGSAIPVSGAVTVSLNGKTVKTWKLTSSAKRTVTWDGLSGGRIVPGKYTVKASVTGPQGSKRTATMYVNVSGKRLVTKYKTITLQPEKVFTLFETYGTEAGECSVLQHQKVYCESFGGDMDGWSPGGVFEGITGWSLGTWGGVSVPTAVREAEFASVGVTLTISMLGGSMVWDAYSETEDPDWRGMHVDYAAFDRLTLEPGQKAFEVGVILNDYSEVWFESVKTEYRYKVLE